MVHDHHKIDRKSKWQYLGCVDPANNESIFPFLLLLAVLLKPPAALFAWIKSNIGSVGIDSTDFYCVIQIASAANRPMDLNETREAGKLVDSVASYNMRFYLISMLYCCARISCMGARSLTQKKDSDCTGSHSMANRVRDGSWHRTMEIVYRQERWINIKIHSTRKNCNATNPLK